MKTAIVAAFALLFSMSVSAQNIYRTSVRQHARINQGMRHHTITPRERMAIARKEQNLRLATRVARSDGRITPAERHIIHREQIQASNTIYRAKHNNRNW